MTQHKVLSDDSMTAMDEIARVLGQDAVILSTKKICLLYTSPSPRD